MSNKDFEIISCSICNSSDYETISVKGQFSLPTHVVVCKQCGFSYLNPRWTKERYNQFYAHEYDTFFRPQVYKKESEESKFSSIKTIVSRLKTENVLPNNPQKILDIGSGMGYGLIYLKENIFSGAEYFAIESSLHCKEFLNSNGINVLTSDVDSDWDQNYEGAFDFIILRHVLEHFLSPIDVLKKISKVLKPDGIVYIAVPNAMKPKRPMLSYYFRVVHVSYFSKVSLLNAFLLSGLKPIKIKEGDSADPYELFCVCRPTTERHSVVCVKENYLAQKKIYIHNLLFEPYYSFKLFIWKLIRLFYKK